MSLRFMSVEVGDSCAAVCHAWYAMSTFCLALAFFLFWAVPLPWQ